MSYQYFLNKEGVLPKSLCHCKQSCHCYSALHGHSTSCLLCGCPCVRVPVRASKAIISGWKAVHQGEGGAQYQANCTSPARKGHSLFNQ